MFRLKFTKVFVLSVCLSVFSAGAVNASVGEDVKKGAAEGGGEIGITMVSGSPDEPVSSPAAAAISADILKKQVEIDTYLFKEHQKEIEQKGISVTHTAPFETYVEIGIMPLNDENATYLYGLFGKDKVKVVDGQKVITMSAMTEPAPGLAQQGNAAVEPAMDAEIYETEDIKSDAKNATVSGSEADGRVYKTTSAQENEEIYTTTAINESSSTKADSALMITLGAAGAVVLLGGTAILLKKRKQAAN